MHEREFWRVKMDGIFPVNKEDGRAGGRGRRCRENAANMVEAYGFNAISLLTTSLKVGRWPVHGIEGTLEDGCSKSMHASGSSSGDEAGFENGSRWAFVWPFPFWAICEITRTKHDDSEMLTCVYESKTNAFVNRNTISKPLFHQHR